MTNTPNTFEIGPEEYGVIIHPELNYRAIKASETPESDAAIARRAILAGKTPSNARAMNEHSPRRKCCNPHEKVESVSVESILKVVEAYQKKVDGLAKRITELEALAEDGQEASISYRADAIRLEQEVERLTAENAELRDTALFIMDEYVKRDVAIGNIRNILGVSNEDLEHPDLTAFRERLRAAEQDTNATE